MIPQLNIWGREISLGVRRQLWRVGWGSTFSERILLPSTICTEQASSGDGIMSQCQMLNCGERFDELSGGIWSIMAVTGRGPLV